MKEGRKSLATFPNTNRYLRLIGEFRAALIKDLKVYTRYPAWIASEFITLPLWFVFFALGVFLYAAPGKFGSLVGTPNVFSFFYWGFIFIIIFSTSIWGMGQSIRNEQLQGTIEQLFLAPISRITIIAGRFTRTILTDLIIVLYTSALILAVSGVAIPMVNPLLFGLVYILFELGVLGFGLFFAAIAFRVKSFNLLANLTQFLVIGICGVFFPVTILPRPIQLVSLSIPFTYYADLLRYSSGGCSTATTCTILDPALEVPLAFAMSIVLLGLGLLFFRVIERGAQRRGSIGTH